MGVLLHGDAQATCRAPVAEQEYKVPPGNYFVLGDNRDNSLDSRTPPDQGGVGDVPLDNVVARVEVVLYNLGRPDRTLKPVP